MDGPPCKKRHLERDVLVPQSTVHVVWDPFLSQLPPCRSYSELSQLFPAHPLLTSKASDEEPE
ncbi:hypothetical protein H5410_060184 [Solanum commersonii]|uniref:Uncharacterized protein n=1 Tax=Solanum commersonii TaxID=4109 RepID=A0A9J5W4I1_SOLCO|nr:hypothetical protein H5410_060184 [Solanum commersonii]